LEGSAINYLTRHLESVLLLTAIVCPTGFCANVSALLKGRRAFGRSLSLSDQLVGFVVGYAIVVVVTALFRPHEVLVFRLPTFLPVLLLAPCVGLACIALEYLSGVGWLFLRTGRIVTRATIDLSYSAYSRIDAIDIASVTAFLIGEELILRQFLFSLLRTDFALALWPVCLICAAVFAVNHLPFGTSSAVSKLSSGLLYVLLYYLSGRSVLVVILAHAAQNLTLLAWSRRVRTARLA
jgi:membrane protease YdiL (CAAX protease family)